MDEHMALEQAQELFTVKKEQLPSILHEKKNEELLVIMKEYRELHYEVQDEINAIQKEIRTHQSEPGYRQQVEQLSQQHAQLLKRFDRVNDIHLTAFSELINRGCSVRWDEKERKFVIVSEGNPRTPTEMIEETNRMLATYKRELPEKEHKREFALTAVASAISTLLDYFSSLSSLSLEEKRGLVTMRKLLSELFSEMR